MKKNLLYKILAAKVEELTLNGVASEDVLGFITEHLLSSLGWQVVSFEDSDPAIPARIFRLGKTEFHLNETVIRAYQATVAIAALNTLLFGRYGEGSGLEKADVKGIKEYLDSIATHAYNEMLYHLTNHFPKNQAIFIFQGEGKAEKAGSAAGAPTLSWGRVYAHPETAQAIERHIDRYLVEKGSTVKSKKAKAFQRLISAIERDGIKITGLILDTLENTGRSAKGEETGPMSVAHMVNGPCITEEDFESYALTTTLTTDVAERIDDLTFDTPVEDIVKAVTEVHPEITPDKIDVFTLYDKKTRTIRLQERWDDWEGAGANIIQHDDVIGHTTDEKGRPIELRAFRGSGTYAPNYLVGVYEVNGVKRYLINDGYAATAEALQGLSAATATGRTGIIQQTLPGFKLPFKMEKDITRLDPRNDNFERMLRRIVGRKTGNKLVDDHVKAQTSNWDAFVERISRGISQIRDAGYMPGRVLTPQDILHHRHTQLQSIAFDAMLKLDPYSGIKGIEVVTLESGEIAYKVNVRTAIGGAPFVTTFTLTAEEGMHDIPKILARPLGERLIGYAPDWRDYKYEFDPSHVGQIKRYLVHNQYAATRVVGQTYYVSEEELRKLFRFPAIGDAWAQVLRHIKEVGGAEMDWLVIMEDFDGFSGQGQGHGQPDKKKG